MEPIELTANDGVKLAATRFLPSVAPKAVVVLPAAMGVRQDFYFPFAEYLPGQGRAVITLRVPLLSISFKDDEMMNRIGIDKMHDCYRNAQVERRYISPPDVDARRIGHFGFFRP